LSAGRISQGGAEVLSQDIEKTEGNVEGMMDVVHPSATAQQIASWKMSFKGSWLVAHGFFDEFGDVVDLY